MSRRTIALIAHDNKKQHMVEFARAHAELLARYELIATHTTGTHLRAQGLDVALRLSGPLGGDVQIAAEVACGQVAAVIFFIDPLGKHPHDPDIQSLLRICNVHDVPLATNPSTARCILSANLP